MNEKRAKRLRRQAREQAEGLPERAYRGVKHIVRVWHPVLRKHVNEKAAERWQVVLADSIRKHYKLLKQGRIPSWS